ncbi:MAG: ABC transporter permease subunit [Acidocella sp.]|uniref:ABC transporter permease subunit n=1 Tax=Acidocella sp. TaxID=50710 RepID=UPI003FC2B444
MTAVADIADWISGHKLPVGPWAEAALAALTAHCAGPVNALSAGLSGLLGGTAALLGALPAVPVIVAVTVAAWLLKRSWALTLFVPLGLLFILNQGYWPAMLQTVAQILYATLACMALGVPLGILLAHHQRLRGAVQPVLDLMQTLPTFVYLIPTLELFGLGDVPGLISTIIFVLPTPIRLTCLGILNVPQELLEAGDAFGAGVFARLRKVELPAALPAVQAGLSQTVMLSLSMAVIAALVGAGGLGDPVVEAMESVQVGDGVTSGLAIVIVAIIIDRLFRPKAAT